LRGLATTRLKIWDMPVRLFHWALVAAFLLCGVSGFLGRMELHALAGEAVLALVLFRAGWGLAGSQTARFSDFVKGPSAVLAYLRDHRSHRIGHNPLGGWMVVALLAVLALQAGLGLAGNDDVLFDGPWAHLLPKRMSDAATGFHRVLVWGLMAMAAAHVLAVIVHRIFFQENLVWPMIAGWKTVTVEDAAKKSIPANPLRALAVAAASLFLVWWMISAS